MNEANLQEWIPFKGWSIWHFDLLMNVSVLTKSRNFPVLKRKKLITLRTLTNPWQESTNALCTPLMDPIMPNSQLLQEVRIFSRIFSFKMRILDAPDFHDKPHIVQRDNGNVIVIKVRAKSHLEMKAEWFKVKFKAVSKRLTDRSYRQKLGGKASKKN